MITKNELIEFANHCGKCGYDAERKEKYRKLGRKILREIVKLLGLQKGEYEIRWNPGGIAVDGDHILHTEKFYLSLDDNLGSGWFFWRKCHGMKDYGTGMDCPNQIYNWTTLTAYGLEPLVETLRKVQQTA